MISIRFPDMFANNSTKVVKNFEATKQNTMLLLHCEKGELFGDPYYGLRFKRFLYNQNNYILKDMIIDEIYTQLVLFIPQLRINRNDINIVQEKAKLYCNFKATNLNNFTTDMYSLVLYDEDSDQNM